MRPGPEKKLLKPLHVLRDIGEVPPISQYVSASLTHAIATQLNTVMHVQTSLQRLQNSHATFPLAGFYIQLTSTGFAVSRLLLGTRTLHERALVFGPTHRSLSDREEAHSRRVSPAKLPGSRAPGVAIGSRTQTVSKTLSFFSWFRNIVWLCFSPSVSACSRFFMCGTCTLKVGSDLPIRDSTREKGP